MSSQREFGDFVVVEEIGVGAMGTVYRAIQKSLDRPVALKIPDPILEKDASFVRRFEHEAKRAARLKHENVVQVIAYGQWQGSHYIAMELLEGNDLQHYMKTHGTPPLEIGILIFRDLCRAIEHAHENDIIHRDLKPANVMLTKDGAVKVTDFGLARSTDDSTIMMTRPGTIMGTPAYISPEQAAGEPAGPQSDMFSLGVVGYELMGGERPFKGDYTTVVRAILTIDPPPLHTVNPLLPDRAIELINRMLAKDPAKRYSTMTHVCNDLETIIEDMSVRRERVQIREYANDPAKVSEVLRKERLRKHLAQGLHYETMGHSKIDAATREFERVLYLDPEHEVAREHLTKLEVERGRQAADDEATLVTPIPAALRVLSDPAGARVTLDGGTLVQDSPAEFVDLGPGTHSVRVELTGFRTAERKVSLEPGQELPLTVALRPAGNPLKVALWLAIPAIALVLVLFGTGVIDRGAPSRVVAPAPEQPAPEPLLPEQPAPVPPKAESPAPEPVLPEQPKPEPPKAESSRVEAPRPEAPTPAPIESNEKTTAEAVKAVKPAKPAPVANGVLEIRAVPFASYYVNDQLKAKDLPFAHIELKPGAYKVRIEHPALGAHEWPGIGVEAGATTTLTHDFLQAAPGTLRVSSGGIYAEVYLDGKNTGKTTPCIIEGILAGDHEVTLVREGYVVKGGPKTVTVQPNAEVSVIFALTRR